jgi:phosphoribosylformylglycinamidine cyclo-ligase
MTTYKNAGVDKEEGYKTVDLIKPLVKKTYNKNVLTELGQFGALYELGKYNNPVLVSGTDGVGTKIKIALEVKKLDTIGIDCFAMCANDISCHGAKPLFFLDYLACGKLDAHEASEIIKGMAHACEQTGTALIGGETAEMPGMYKIGDYDVAGFCVGIVEKENIITGANINEGDTIIGIASSGLHSNGFSLVRKLIPDLHEVFNNEPIWKTLLTPTALYSNIINSLVANFKIKGIAHITGGGLYENVPRIIPESMCANIYKDNIPQQPIFKLLQERGKIEEKEMHGTFNMGVGLVIVVEKAMTEDIIKHIQENNLVAFHLGNIISNSENKIIIN